MDQHRIKALKVAVEHIDHHRGQYESFEEQNEMLANMIERHNLRTKTKGKKETDLHVETYRQALHNTVSKYIIKTKPKIAKITQFFLQGSRVLAPELLEKIGYAPLDSVIDSEQGDDNADEYGSTETEDQVNRGATRAKTAQDGHTNIIQSRHQGKALQLMESTTYPASSGPTSQHQHDPHTTALSPPSVHRDNLTSVERAVTENLLRGQKRKSVASEDEAPTRKKQKPSVDLTHDTRQSSSQTQASSVKPHYHHDPQAPAFSPISAPTSVRDNITAAAPSSSARVNASGEQCLPRDSAATGKKRKSPDSAEEAPIAKKQKSSINLTQTDQQAISNSKAALAERFEANKLIKLGTSALEEGLNTLSHDIFSFVYRVLPKAAFEKGPVFCAEPDERMLSIYQRLYGTQWKNRVNFFFWKTNVPFQAGDVLQGCIAAALYDSVFSKEIPWNGPKKTMEELAPKAKYMDAVLRASDYCSLHYLVWQAARNEFLDKDFQNATITPIAQDLADSLMLALRPQLIRLGVTSLDESTLQQRHRDMTAMFKQALVLKGQMATAPDYYECRWVESGDILDRETMDEIHQSEGPHKVTWCVSPMIMAKSYKDSEWRVACPAKVFSRPTTSSVDAA